MELDQFCEQWGQFSVVAGIVCIFGAAALRSHLTDRERAKALSDLLKEMDEEDS